MHKKVGRLIKRLVFVIFEKVCLTIPLFNRMELVEYLSKLNIGYLDCKMPNEIKMHVSSHASFSRLNSCKKEPKTIEWIEKYFNSNDVFYDVGANVGAYSMYACSKYKGRLQIFAFEPSFHTFPVLYNNIYLNGFQKSILPLNIALSNENNIAEFSYRSIDSGSAEHPGLEQSGNILYSQKLMVYTLDYVVKYLKIPYPNHIKIDVDGHEYSVLQGADDVLNNKNIKSIQLEADIDSNACKQITEYLENKNFKIHKKNQHANSTTFDLIFVKKNKDVL